MPLVFYNELNYRANSLHYSRQMNTNRIKRKHTINIYPYACYESWLYFPSYPAM